MSLILSKEITLEEMIQDAVASTEMEGFKVKPSQIELIRLFAENKNSLPM